MAEGQLTKASIPNLLHAQGEPLWLIIVASGSETVLPVVRAIHTIEMIPKSMILTFATILIQVFIEFVTSI